MQNQCELAGVSRAGFYRHLQEQAAGMLLRDRLQQLAAATRRRQGYRVLTHTLREEGHVVNHKRVLRLMREDNLLCLRSRAYVMTTDSRHTWQVYPNLVPSLRVTGLNQLWVSDITFVRMRCEYVYLAVVLDAYSRRIIGWALSRILDAQLAIGALKMALESRRWRPGQLVHHSDRGVHYAASAYTDLLEEREILISMSRKGNPYDNAKAERFMRTLKEEEVQGQAYANLAEAKSRMEEFLEEIYNRQRLHSAPGYLTPVAFEQKEEAVEADGRLEDRGTGHGRFTGSPTVLGNPCRISTAPAAR